MTPEVEALLNALTVFTLAILVGFTVISKVPATLHTPLMSGANSIHGIVLVGAMIIAAEADDALSGVLALAAAAFAPMSVVGRSGGAARSPRRAGSPAPGRRPRSRPSPSGRRMFKAAASLVVFLCHAAD